VSLTLAEDIASLTADAALSALDRGYLRLYAGSGALLVELRFAAPAFDSATAGRARARPMASAVTQAAGRARTFRAFRADGVRLVFDGRVGTEADVAAGAADLALDNPDLQLGARVEVTRVIYRQPMTSE
jgi:hypothetical protein